MTEVILITILVCWCVVITLLGTIYIYKLHKAIYQINQLFANQLLINNNQRSEIDNINFQLDEMIAPYKRIISKDIE